MGKAQDTFADDEENFDNNCMDCNMEREYVTETESKVVANNNCYMVPRPERKHYVWREGKRKLLRLRVSYEQILNIDKTAGSLLNSCELEESSDESIYSIETDNHDEIFNVSPSGSMAEGLNEEDGTKDCDKDSVSSVDKLSEDGYFPPKIKKKRKAHVRVVERETKRRRLFCPMEECPAKVVNLTRHLKQVHGIQRKKDTLAEKTNKNYNQVMERNKFENKSEVTPSDLDKALEEYRYAISIEGVKVKLRND